jgi:Ca-activated chloride channel family protein
MPSRPNRCPSAELEPMETNHTPFDDGTRVDISVEFITRRQVDVPDGAVERLLMIGPEGRRFPVLATADTAALLDLKTGATHHLEDLLLARPIDMDAAGSPDCPNCGRRTRPKQALDSVPETFRAAAEALGLKGVFGIFDDRTSLDEGGERTEAVDDWQANTGIDEPDGVPDRVCTSCGHEFANGAHQANQVHYSEASPVQSKLAESPSLGMATGGGKDVGNFRENVLDGYTPQPESITDEGLFYDYHFETGARAEGDALFAPRYATAVSDHPITGATERYLSVGLDSTLSAAAFERPRLDLVAVLDISGSMETPFDEYYYDEHGREHATGATQQSKLAAATSSLCALTEQLDSEDRLGVVLYNDQSQVAKPLRDVGRTDMPAIREHIRELEAGGGTNLEAGFETAVEMLRAEASEPPVERRVVFMTDMMPNVGETDTGTLTERFAAAATDGIHTTFIGMGLDANAELAERLSGIRGANHYFVRSASEFERRLGEEFDYMVTPLVYDLTLEIDGEGYAVDTVHGSPSGEAASGRLMHVGTLFPSAKQDGEARGGVVLVQLEQTGPAGNLDLVASWTERGGGEHTERVTVDLPDNPETFEHTGIRKAVALTRYAGTLRDWASTVRQEAAASDGVDPATGAHERGSVPLRVPERYATRFEALQTYLEAEMEAVGDDTLSQEVETLSRLCEVARGTAVNPTD